MKVLIVDDNNTDRKLLRYNFERHGCEVILEGCNGKEGFELAKAHMPDLIISDALMPVMDGFHFLRKVKTDEALKSIPFIFYSAVYTGNKDLELADSLGAAAFIVKPVEPDEFWKILKATLKKVEQKEELPPRDTLIEEEEYLTRYSDIVATKLEEKVQELTREIAERKRTEEELRESEGKLNAMLRSIGDHISMVDKDLNIIWANDITKKFFGHDIVGKKCYAVYYKRGNPCEPYPCLTLRAFKDGKYHEHNTKLIDREGNELYYHSVANVALRGENGAPEAVIIISPGLTDLPDNIFSADGITPKISTGKLDFAAAKIVPATTAAPDISAFISAILFEGFIEIPPESKVTPFPTSAIFFLFLFLFFTGEIYSSTIKRGGFSLPIPMAVKPPIFLFLISFSLKTVAFTFTLLKVEETLFANSFGVIIIAGSFSRSLAKFTPSIKFCASFKAVLSFFSLSA